MEFRLYNTTIYETQHTLQPQALYIPQLLSDILYFKLLSARGIARTVVEHTYPFRMFRIALIASFFFNLCFAFAQNNKDEVYSGADEFPTFENGMQGFYWFVSDNLNYPDDALSDNIEGSVLVQFIVNKDGEVTDEKVVRSLYESIDAEALRVMKLCPNWNPAILRGKPCNMRMEVPIFFKVLTEEEKLKNKKIREKLEKKLKKKQLKQRNKSS